MSSDPVIVEIISENGTKTVGLDCSVSANAWQVTQLLSEEELQDGGENSIASDKIVLRNRYGTRLHPSNRINKGLHSKMKDKTVHLIAEIIEEGRVKNGEHGDKVKRSIDSASSDSEDSHNVDDTNPTGESNEKHTRRVSRSISLTEYKRRKIHGNEARNSSDSPGAAGGTSEGKSKSAKPTDDLNVLIKQEVAKDLVAKQQQVVQRCLECGCTGERRATLQLGFKRNHGWLGSDQSTSNILCNLRLRHRTECSCDGQEKSTSGDEGQKMTPNSKLVPVISSRCTDTLRNRGSLEETHSQEKKCKYVSKDSGDFVDKSVEIKSKHSSTKVKQEAEDSTNKSVEIKSKHSSTKLNKDACESADKSVEIKSRHFSSRVNKDSGGSTGKSVEVNSKHSPAKVSRDRRTAIEIVLNTDSLRNRINKNVAMKKSTNGDADGKISRKHSPTKISKDGCVSTDRVADTPHLKTRFTEKVDVKKSANNCADSDQKYPSTTCSVNKVADKLGQGNNRKHSKTVNTGKTVGLGKSTRKGADIVKNFTKQSEDHIQEKSDLINLQTVSGDLLDLVENISETAEENDYMYVDGLYEPHAGTESDSKFHDDQEKSFIDDPHDDEIHSIPTEDCDSEEFQKGVHSTSDAGDDTVVINIGRNELRYSDLETLREGEWLNDCVINAYFFLLSQASPLNVFTHSSFFFFSLYKRGYEGVQRWTKNVDLFAQDLIFIPVHNKSHWTLVAVHIKDGVIEYYNSSTFHDGYPNSMKYIKDYLKAEAVHRGKTEFCDVDWNMYIIDKIPRQQNSDDCGLFICQYAKKMSFSQNIRFDNKRTANLRDQMLRELHQGETEEDEN